MKLHRQELMVSWRGVETHRVGRCLPACGVLFAGVFLLPLATAEAQVSFGSATIPNPLRAPSFAGVFAGFVDLFLFFGLIVAGLLIVYAGILMLTALGNERRLELAKSVFTWGIIGFIVLFLAKVIEITIRRFIGL